MGLYDNYVQSNSTSVVQPVPGLSNHVARVQQGLMRRYETAAAAIPELDQVVQSAPFLEQDKEGWASVRKDVDGKLQEWGQRKDLENLGADIGRYANEVTGKLKHYANAASQKQAYNKSIDDDKELPRFIKDFYKRQAADNYKGLQFDEYGRPTNGYGGRNAVKHVDNTEQVRKAIAIRKADGDASKVTVENGSYVVTRENGVKEIIEQTELAKIVNAAIGSNQTWRESINQEVNAAAYNRVANLDENSILQFAESEDNPFAKGLKQLIDQGIDPKRAALQMESQRAHNDLMGNIHGYTQGGAYVKYGDSYEQKISSLKKDEINRAANFDVWKQQKAISDVYDQEKEKRAAAREDAKAASTSPFSSITMPSRNYGQDATYEALNEQETTSKTRIGELKDIAGQWVELDKNGQPKIRNGKYVMKNGKSVQNIPPSVSTAIDQLDSEVANLTNLTKQRRAILNEAAANQGFDDNGNREGSYDRMVANRNQKLEKYFKGLPADQQVTAYVLDKNGMNHNAPDGSPNGNSGKKHMKTISVAEIRKQILKDPSIVGRHGTHGGVHSIKYKIGPDQYAYIPLGSYQGSETKNKLPGFTDVLNTIRDVETKVNEDAKTNYEKYNKNFSLVTPAVSIDLANKSTKPLANDIVTAISSNRGAVTVKDETGEVLGKDEFNYLQLSQAKSISTYKKGNKVVANIVIPTGNKEKPEKVIEVEFPATSNIGDRLFNSLKNSTDPGIQEAAMTFNPYSQMPQITELSANETLKVSGSDNLFYERVNAGTNPYYKIFLKKPDGTKTYLREKDVNPSARGDKPFMTNSLSQLELNAMKQLSE